MDAMADHSGDAASLRATKIPIESSVTRPQSGQPGKGSPCHTCRRGRLRCDASKPTCKKCAKRGVECLGYGTQAFLWVQPSAPDTARQSSTEANSISLPMLDGQEGRQRKKRGRPKLVLLPKPVEKVGTLVTSHEPPASRSQHTQGSQESVTNKTVDTALASQVIACQHKTPPKPGPVPVKYHESLLALRSLDYINKFIAPDMVLVDSHHNPHRVDISLWHYIPDVYMDLLICVAWTHQLVRCHSAQHVTFRSCFDHTTNSVALRKSHLASMPDPTVRKIFKRMHSSIRLLNELLDDLEMRYSDIVLSIVITLMRVEVQQSAFGAWPAHLHAARIIVKKRGGFAQVLNADQGYLGRSYITGDVMSSVFSPQSMLEWDATISQLEYIPLLECFYKDGRETDFPCPNQIVEALIRINNERLVTEKGMSNTTLCSTRSEILQLITSFDPQFWAHDQLEELKFGYETSNSLETDLLDLSLDGEVGPIASIGMRDEVHRSCTEIARAFQYASMLYCLRTLYIDQGDSHVIAFTPHSKMQTQGLALVDALSLHQIALRNLLQSLHSLWVTDTASAAFLGKLSLWPLWTAGMELDLHQGLADERAFITTTLLKLCAILGGLAPLDAISALNLVWENTELCAALGTKATWDEKIVLPGMRGMFFF